MSNSFTSQTRAEAAGQALYKVKQMGSSPEEFERCQKKLMAWVDGRLWNPEELQQSCPDVSSPQNIRYDHLSRSWTWDISVPAPNNQEPLTSRAYQEQYREPPKEAVDLALTAFVLDKPLMLHDAWLTHQHGSLFARLRYFPPTEEFKTEWRDMIQAWLVKQCQSFPEMKVDIQKSFVMPDKHDYNNGVDYKFQVVSKNTQAPIKVGWFKRFNEQHNAGMLAVGCSIVFLLFFISLYLSHH